MKEGRSSRWDRLERRDSERNTTSGPSRTDGRRDFDGLQIGDQGTRRSRRFAFRRRKTFLQINEVTEK